MSVSPDGRPLLLDQKEAKIMTLKGEYSYVASCLRLCKLRCP
jgi:hypothetical protein